MPRATVLIATRNRAAQLRAALHSIQHQKYEGVPVVVVDDGSTDETPRILAEFNGAFSVHRIEREGGYRNNPSAVLNAGHALCKTGVVIEQGGEVCHLNDCVTPLLAVCRPGTVALARVYHGTFEELETARAAVERGDLPLGEDYIPEVVKTVGDTWRVPVPPPLGIRLYCGLERAAPFLFLGAIHSEDFRAVGGYDEQRHGRNDEDLANRLLARGVRFCFSGRAVAFHVKHDKS